MRLNNRLGRRAATIRIHLPYVYTLAEAFEPLSKLRPNVSFLDVFVSLWSAQGQLEALMGQSVFANSLRSCRPFAETLHALLQKETSNTKRRRLGPNVVIPIFNAFTQFKTALLAEVGTLPAYFVSQKGSHDTLTLLDESWRIFPQDLRDKVPDAMFDVAEAGKALCYELPTACGFHLFRATEAVLRRYYSHVSGGRPPPKIRNIAVYVNAMRQRKCGDEKILSVIDQMSKLHRNPVIHPEVVLTLDEAISILGMAHSAVTAMLTVLPILPPTTSAIIAFGRVTLTGKDAEKFRNQVTYGKPKAAAKESVKRGLEMVRAMSKSRKGQFTVKLEAR
jgi:hypothetical protein